MAIFKYKTKDQAVFLYRRRFLFWKEIDHATFLYSQHRLKIIETWISMYGKENFDLKNSY